MNRLALILMLLAASASAAPNPAPAHRQNVIEIERDSQRGVTCYILNGVGISCVPDSQLKPEAKPTPTDAPDRRVDERYSM
ncbi:hypothetical protein PSCICO_31690 [Pseudomonas cichorii]|uniref:hypothetical protein n=1 Tax=Pseudomonas cichorii TaxID=36746 RepID=UPI0019100D90|nr:hypothetical protein [Pseudomonas cichorii]GFM87770.1 hypothetical protein PSCICO_31690 [Pseudomonas cichorii]